MPLSENMAICSSVLLFIKFTGTFNKISISKFLSVMKPNDTENFCKNLVTRIARKND